MKVVLGIAAVEVESLFPFGKQTFYFEDIVKATTEFDIEIFFFSPLQWNGQNHHLAGYHYKNLAWEKTNQKIPNLIYDRAFGKSATDKAKVEKFRNHLRTGPYQILNPIALSEILNSKTAFHHFLQQCNLPTLAAYPIDFILDKAFELSLNGGTEYYIKPTFGTGGFGIYVVQLLQGDLLLKNNINSEKRQFATTAALHEFVKDLSTETEYFMQPKAKIINYNEKPFDIRVIVQNHSYNDYRITGMGVRLGLKESFVSNLNSGGTAIPVEGLTDYYREFFRRDLKEDIEIMKKVCLSCCAALHKRFGNFLEIGFDILLTKDEGPVILEGNSKPSRWIFNLLADYDKSDPDKTKMYKQMRIDSCKIPVIFTLNNFPTGGS